MADTIKKYFIQRHDIDGIGIDVEVPNNNIDEIVHNEEALGKYAYGFSLYEINETEIDGKTFKSDKENVVEVIIGDVVTEEDVLSDPKLSDYERGNLEFAFNQLANSNYSVSGVMAKTERGALKEIPKKAVVVNKQGVRFNA